MKINERSLIEGLSYALDVAERSYFSHSKHVAYISIMVAKELQLSFEEQTDIYFSALLHDIGSSNTYNIIEHCRNGRDILLTLPVKKEYAEYIYYHHEHFDGTNAFFLKGNEIPLPSQIICMADLFDKTFRSIDKISYSAMETIINWIDVNQEKFNPRVSDAFKRLIEKEYILLDYFNNEFNRILNLKIDVIGKDLNYEEVLAYSHVFSKIIDNRSPFTYSHSVGIADIATKITKSLGYDEEYQHKMYIAALLHDIGKLVVPFNIIDKDGPLDASERFEINKHTYYTRWILSQIEGFEDITEFASNHHEKLTGKGYPLQLSESKIGKLDRIMAICDIYQALSEERPYRHTMPIEKVWSIIDSMVDKGELDKSLVEEIKTILIEDNK